MKIRPTALGILLLTVCGLVIAAGAQSNVPPQPVPIIDGGLGRCSVELAIMNADGKPVASASVKVHIAYGFGGFHKLDLEAGANIDGKVKFTGLPSSVRRPPLEFRASSREGHLEGKAEYDPAAECHANREIKLAASAQP
jgi:hypothetical protein